MSVFLFCLDHERAIVGWVVSRSVSIVHTDSFLIGTFNVQYWRIGNKFYDLTPFLDKHPGGRALLEMARDRFDDSTYAFESHHHNQAKVRKMLDLYEVKGVVPPQCTDSNRTFPNLMPEDTFFSEFRRRATKWLKVRTRRRALAALHNKSACNLCSCT